MTLPSGVSGCRPSGVPVVRLGMACSAEGGTPHGGAAASASCPGRRALPGWRAETQRNATEVPHGRRDGVCWQGPGVSTFPGEPVELIHRVEDDPVESPGSCPAFEKVCPRRARMDDLALRSEKLMPKLLTGRRRQACALRDACLMLVARHGLASRRDGGVPVTEVVLERFRIWL